MDPVRGAVRLDTERFGVDAFRDGWKAQIGDGFTLPAFNHEATSGAIVRGCASRVGDSAITDFETATRVQVDSAFPDNGELRMYVVHRGAYILRRERDTVVVDAGQFLLSRSIGLTGYDVAAGTSAQVIGLPAEALGVFADSTRATGPAAAAEVRVLLAHTRVVQATLGDLSDDGVHASRNALVELVRGVLHGYVDGTEPGPLVHAARNLADQLLTNPDLTPALLASHLKVSLRTLHRAFASTGEPVTAYIRRRRLEQARRALLSPSHSTVSEIAARWQFADSSHFIRTFRRYYGQTPARFARDHYH
ncbi:helix-turn-helix domain-containing protein [Lentzea kentuckyensis]|uniref:helix-turn-helix domain-containing protein n=1 Tax=Lentzea kentuckyensis TaxID=360086 RepID=UPI001B80656C|nr:helix-turn-helix domain-containing protein [Lentzea kentuckyensis]